MEVQELDCVSTVWSSTAEPDGTDRITMLDLDDFLGCRADGESHRNVASFIIFKKGCQGRRFMCIVCVIILWISEGRESPDVFKKYHKEDKDVGHLKLRSRRANHRTEEWNMDVVLRNILHSHSTVMGLWFSPKRVHKSSCWHVSSSFLCGSSQRRYHGIRLC